MKQLFVWLTLHMKALNEARRLFQKAFAQKFTSLFINTTIEEACDQGSFDLGEEVKRTRVNEVILPLVRFPWNR